MLFAIVLLSGVLFFNRLKVQAENLPPEYKLGDIMKGQAAERAQDVEKAKQEAESKEQRIKQARITPHEKIKVS